MQKAAGLGRNTKWTSWHLSDQRMIHVYCGTLRSGQNNQRSLYDTRRGAGASPWAKATNGRPVGEDTKDEITQDVSLWQKQEKIKSWMTKKTCPP